MIREGKRTVSKWHSGAGSQGGAVPGMQALLVFNQRISRISSGEGPSELPRRLRLNSSQQYPFQTQSPACSLSILYTHHLLTLSLATQNTAKSCKLIW